MGRGKSKGMQQPQEVARGSSLKSSEGTGSHRALSTRVTVFPGDIWQPRHNRGCHWIHGWRPGVLLNTLRCIRQPQRSSDPNVSSAEAEKP